MRYTNIIHDINILSKEDQDCFSSLYNKTFEYVFEGNTVDFMQSMLELYHMSVSIIDVKNYYGLSLFEMCQFYGKDAYIKIILDYEKALLSKTLLAKILLSKEINFDIIRDDVESLSDLQESIALLSSNSKKRMKI